MNAATANGTKEPQHRGVNTLALNMHQINVNKSLVYLGMVAYECNISVVSRQLVIISTFFVLFWKKERCCESFTGRGLTDNTAFVWIGMYGFRADLMWFMLLTQKKHTDAHKRGDLQTCLCSRTLTPLL